MMGKTITETKLSYSHVLADATGSRHDRPLKTVNILFHRNILKDKGGTSMYIRTLSKELAKYFRVNVFMYDDGPDITVTRRNQVRLFSLPRPKIPILSLLEKSSQGKKFYDVISAFDPRLLILSEKIAPSDYVLCVDSYCAIVSGPLARTLGKKLVLRCNDSVLSISSQIFSSFSKMQGLLILLYAFLFENPLLRISHLISVPSRKTKQLFKRYYGLDDNVFVSPPGNEGSSLHAQFSIRKLYGLTSNQPVILFIGTGNWPPNILAIKYIINKLAPFLCKESPDCKIVIVGNHTERFKNSLITDNVIIAGSVDDLGPYLEGSDLAIAPITVIGGVSAKTIEYLCSGLPVIATECVAQTLVPQSGILVSNIDDFHLKVVEALKTSNLRRMRASIRREALNIYCWRDIGIDFAARVNELSGHSSVLEKSC